MDDSTYEGLAQAALIGNRIINAVGAVLTLILLLVGGYTIWYTIMVYQSAFLDDDLLKYKPVPGEEYNPSLEELMEINPDVCAWITIDDTYIDYPVVQGRDNEEYLDKTVFGEFALSGSVFLDKANDRDFADPYSILYGHHMENKAMFGQLPDFLEADFFDGHRTGMLFLPKKTYLVTLFASLETNAYEPRVLDIKKNPADIPSMLAYVQNNAVQYRDLSPALSASDKIIGLVTCERAYTDGRVLLLGRLDEIEFVEQGEDEPEPVKEDEWVDED